MTYRTGTCDGPGGGSGTASADGASAFATLHSVLVAVTEMMAPITPFLADYVWGVLRPAGEPESVHLSSWPVAEASLIDERLSSQMALARRLVDLGRSARSARASGPASHCPVPSSARRSSRHCRASCWPSSLMS